LVADNPTAIIQVIRVICRCIEGRVGPGII